MKTVLRDLRNDFNGLPQCPFLLMARSQEPASSSVSKLPVYDVYGPLKISHSSESNLAHRSQQEALHKTLLLAIVHPG